VQPLLGTLGSLSVRFDLSLELRNTILGSAKLVREPLRCLQRAPTVFFRNASRPVQQLQDCLARFVELVSVCGALAGMRKWDHI
jgi:hypothetical protein